MSRASTLVALLLVVSLAPAVNARERESRGGLVFTTGVTQQSDAVVAGLGAAWRWWVFGADLSAQAGVGVDFWTLRPSLHAIAEANLEGFRLWAIAGPSMLVYRTRGEYAEFCDKAELDCDEIVFGLDLGAGVGWRWLGLEAYFGTGELPLFTIVGKATWLF